MATGETNFSLEGRKTWKKDLTPPAEGEQVLILRSDGDKTAIQSGTSQKTGQPYIPFVKTKAQVKGSGKDGNPDKWVNLTFSCSGTGQRPPIDGQDGFLTFVKALGERCEGPPGSVFDIVRGTHPNPQLADKGPAEWLDATRVADYLRKHDKREFKARLRHQRRWNADKNSTKLEDKEAIIDYYIIDASVAPASPDDAPVDVPDEAVDEGGGDGTASGAYDGGAEAADAAVEADAPPEPEADEPEQEEEPVKEEPKPAPATPAKKPAPKPAAKPAAKSNGKKK